MIKAVIFDMDGVLIDTVELGIRSRKKMLAAYGVNLDSIPDPQDEGHRAASLRSLLTNVEQSTGIHIDHDEFANTARMNMVHDFKKYGICVDINLVRFLDELRMHNIICAIASSGLREGVELKLKTLGIKQYFSTIVTGSDVAAHKPKPDTYLHVLDLLNLHQNECIIFEDSITGIQAGNAAGCQVIGFTQYNPPKQPLKNVIATIKNWSEIDYNKLKELINVTTD